MPSDCNFSRSKHHLFLRYGDRKHRGFEQIFYQLLVDQPLSLLSRLSKALSKYGKHDTISFSRFKLKNIKLEVTLPVINRISDYFDEMQGWRHHMHSNPELGFECFETAEFVKSKLEELGVNEIHSGIAKTGLVEINNGKSGDIKN